MKTLVLADKQDITKAGILYYCNKIAGFGRIVEASDKKRLVSLLQDYPDATVILDYTLFDLNSVDELVVLQERFKHVIWILFSEDLSEDFIRRVIFSSEAIGVMLKDTSQEEIEVALLQALLGKRFLSHRIINMFQHGKKEWEAAEQLVLTSTEQAILKAIALGKTTKEIAAERFSSIHTITTHRKNIFRKLQVNNVYEATKYALRAGIVDAAEYYI